MKFLGLDIGSRFIKSGLFDLERQTIAHIAKEASPGFLPNPNKAVKENDPLEMVRSVRQIIDKASNAHRDIEGIVISTQMHGFVLTDKKGDPVSSYITWQDERTLETVKGTGGVAPICRRSPDYWIRPTLSEAGVRSRRRWAFAVCTIGSGITRQISLCGFVPWVISSSPAFPAVNHAVT